MLERSLNAGPRRFLRARHVPNRAMTPRRRFTSFEGTRTVVPLAGLVLVGCVLLGAFAPAVQAQDRGRADSAHVETESRAAASASSAWSGGYRAQLQWRRQIDATQDARDTTASTQVGGVSLGGLVLDETSSTIGRDFYDVFYSRWQAPKNAANFTVRITEQYAPSLGSQVIVKVGDRTLFRSYLQPNFDQIRKAALNALGRTLRYLQRQHRPRQVY